jgi:hypothetical protein
LRRDFPIPDLPLSLIPDSSDTFNQRMKV